MSTITESQLPEAHSFLASLAAKNRSLATLRSYRTATTRFGQFQHERNKTLLTTAPYDIEEWILTLRQQKLTEASVAAKVSALKSFFRWALSREMIEKNPSQCISYAPKDSIPRKPNLEDAKRFLDSINPRTWSGARDKAIILALYGTGCRVQELCDVRLSDIDLESGQVKVLGKGNKERLCPISSQALEAIVYWVKHHRSERMPKSDYLFVTLDGKQLKQGGIRSMMDTRRRQIGITATDDYPSGIHRNRLTPHAFRHLFATQLLDADAELAVIQELMGHVSIGTTQRYAKATTRLRARTHALLPTL